LEKEDVDSFFSEANEFINEISSLLN